MSSVKDRIAMFQAMKVKQIPPKAQIKKENNQPVSKKSEHNKAQPLSDNSKSKEQNIRPNNFLEIKTKIQEQAARNSRESAKILESKPENKSQNSQIIETLVIKPSDIKNQLQKVLQIGLRPKIVQESRKIPQQQIVYQKQEKRNPNDIKPIQGRQAKPTFEQNKLMLDNLFKQKQRKDEKSLNAEQTRTVQPKLAQTSLLYSNQIPVQHLSVKAINLAEAPKFRENTPQIKITFNQQTKKYYETQEPRIYNQNLKQPIVNHTIPEQRTDYLINRLFPKNHFQGMQGKSKQIMLISKSEVLNLEQPDNNRCLQLVGNSKKKKPSNRKFDDF